MNTDLFDKDKRHVYFELTGNHDEDYFLNEADMSASHWELLMSCHHQGSCDNDCNEASRFFEIKDYIKARDYLVSCGIEAEIFILDDDDADDDEIDESAVLNYYLWMLAGDIQERS